MTSAQRELHKVLGRLSQAIQALLLANLEDPGIADELIRACELFAKLCQRFEEPLQVAETEPPSYGSEAK